MAGLYAFELFEYTLQAGWFADGPACQYRILNRYDIHPGIYIQLAAAGEIGGFAVVPDLIDLDTRNQQDKGRY